MDALFCVAGEPRLEQTPLFNHFDCKTGSLGASNRRNQPVSSSQVQTWSLHFGGMGAGILAPLPWPPPPRCRAAVQEIWQAPDIAFCRLQCGSEGNLPSYTARRVHLPVPQGAERGSQAVKNIGPGPLCPVQGPHRAGAVLRAGVSTARPPCATSAAIPRAAST